MLTRTNDGRPFRVTKIRSCSRSTRSASAERCAFTSENGNVSLIGQNYDLYQPPVTNALPTDASPCRHPGYARASALVEVMEEFVNDGFLVNGETMVVHRRGQRRVPWSRSVIARISRGRSRSLRFAVVRIVGTTSVFVRRRPLRSGVGSSTRQRSRVHASHRPRCAPRDRGRSGAPCGRFDGANITRQMGGSDGGRPDSRSGQRSRAAASLASSCGPSMTMLPARAR